MEPTVLQYLKQYGYSNTLAAMDKMGQDKQNQTTTARKMTIDDSETTLDKIIQAETAVEKQARGYIDEIFN